MLGKHKVAMWFSNYFDVCSDAGHPAQKSPPTCSERGFRMTRVSGGDDQFGRLTS